ncbi:MAG: hypothetical protein ABH813_01805 [Patescibacteria group bacterium]
MMSFLTKKRRTWASQNLVFSLRSKIRTWASQNLVFSLRSKISWRMMILISFALSVLLLTLEVILIK